MLTSASNNYLGSFEIPAPIATLDAFRAWVESDDFPDAGKVTFYAGRVLFDMSPERYESHAYLRREITYAIETLAREADLGEVYLDGSWFTQDDARISNEPDLMFAFWETLESGKLTPSPDQDRQRYSQLIGAPDWVCEIVSDSSEKKDLHVLREAYFKAGIPEYWLLDARGEEIDFKLLTAGDSAYEETPPTPDGWRRSRVFDREFHLSRTRNRVDRWRYELKWR